MKIRIVNTVIWPASVNVPQDGGSTEKHDFFVNFKRISENEFNALSAQQNITLLLNKVVIGAGDTEAEAKAELSDKDKAELLSQSNYRAGLYHHYLQMDAGIALKNSKPLPEVG